MYLESIQHINSNNLVVNVDYSKRSGFIDKSKNFFFRESGEPIEYSLVLAHKIRGYVLEAFSMDKPVFYDPPPSGDPRLDGEIKRFICALAAYNDPGCRPVLPLSFLIDGILDKDFCVLLKKIRFKSFVRSIGGTFCEVDPDLDPIPEYFIDDIGQVFNYRYWFFYSEEDPHDENWSFEPCEPLEAHIVKEFTDTLWSILPEDIEEIDPREILLQSSSSSADSMLQDGSNPVYVEKIIEKNNTFSCKPLHAKIVYVQKSPGDTRGASVHTISQSNTVKLVEKQTAVVASKVRHSAYVSDKDEFDRRFTQHNRKFTRHLCRDLKKDGLTKVRELLVLVLNTLAKKYPDIHTFRAYTGLFSSWSFSYPSDNKVRKPPRGIGLGMSSALTTLIGCTCIQMVLNRLLSRGEY
jgi:hypothetical protein